MGTTKSSFNRNQSGFRPELIQPEQIFFSTDLNPSSFDPTLLVTGELSAIGEGNRPDEKGRRPDEKGRRPDEKVPFRMKKCHRPDEKGRSG